MNTYCRGLGPITKLKGFVLGLKGFITEPYLGLRELFRRGELIANTAE